MKELKLEVLLEAERTGDSIVDICVRRGLSRASYYRYRRRYLDEGLSGLEARSRRPHSSPAQIAAELEAEICALRHAHPRWGARRIHAELRRTGVDPPAVATIHRALRRNRLVAPQRPRRQKATKRFERERPNDLWQIDATELRLANRDKAWVVDCLDDHARFCLAARAAATPDGGAAWACFAAASARYGLPRQRLSDNHLSFTGRLHGLSVDFERKLAALGVELINAAPAHPQTLGKLERFHRTLKEWLAEHDPAGDLAQLQGQLDRFRAHYNGERPHQGIENAIPAERYRPAPPAPIPAAAGLPAYPPHAILRRVSARGEFDYERMSIQIGRRFAGATVRVVPVGELIHVYCGEELARVLVPDRSKRHQPLGKRRRRN